MKLFPTRQEIEELEDLVIEGYRTLAFMMENELMNGIWSYKSESKYGEPEPISPEEVPVVEEEVRKSIDLYWTCMYEFIEVKAREGVREKLSLVPPWSLHYINELKKRSTMLEERLSRTPDNPDYWKEWIDTEYGFYIRKKMPENSEDYMFLASD